MNIIRDFPGEKGDSLSSRRKSEEKSDQNACVTLDPICETPHFWQNRPEAGHPILKLAHAAELIHGPVAEDGLAIDEALIHRAEVAAVVGHGPVIAQHKIRIRGDHGLR